MVESLDRRAKRVFDEAIELRASERNAWLDRTCATDSELRIRVEDLLRGAEKEDAFLRDPTVGAAAVLNHAPISTEQPGGRIGPYELLELIGEGGFGSVFMAEQMHPVRRRVALKIIKLGMDTRAVVARFEQERQALALMDHPNIAKVLDAGATESGRPYFVMELVKGRPITAYCDEHELTISQRLELFIQVCRAVQHAHTKGVIHRDIKPSNVLVSTQDDQPFCRIIDFGIAKAAQQPLTDKVVFTEFRQLIGTPEYMSPEQAEGSLDIDTRSDVYSLGVLLYELLAGDTPFDAQRLRAVAFGEMQRIIREVEPPTPSTRLSRANSTLAGIAGRRRIEPRKLGTAIRGDLDWIVMKAIEKTRSRRYETAADLAADVERHLSSDPIIAAPPGRVYRLRKFVKRHRGGVTTAMAIALTMIAGIAGTTDFAVREAHARTRAVAAETSANQKADDLTKIVQFQESQLRGIDPKEMGARLARDLIAEVKASVERAAPDRGAAEGRVAELESTLRQANLTNVALKTLDETIFDRALKSADEQFKDQPLIKARLLQVLADTLNELGLLDRASAPQTEALAIRRSQLGNRNADTLYSVHHMGILLQAQGKLPESETYLREAVQSMPAVMGEDSRDTLSAISNLGLLLQLQGKLAEAEPYYRDSLERCRRLFGPEHVDTLGALNNMGFLLFAQGKLSEAGSYFRDALERTRRVKGNDDPDTLAIQNNLASIIQRQGTLAEAEAMFHDGLERSRRAQGEDHPTTLQFANNMGFVLYLEGKLAESEPFTRDTLERRRRVLRDDHWDTMQSINNMGLLLQAGGKLDEAEPFFREALERRRRVLGESHQATLQSICNLGVLLRDQGKLNEAEPLLRDALDKRRSTLGDDHPDTLESHNSIGLLYAAQNKLADADRELRVAVDGYSVKFGEDNPETARVRFRLGVVLRDEGRFAEAETSLLKAEAGLRGTLSAKAPEHKACMEALVKLYEMWEQAEPSQGHGAKAAPWRSN